MSAADIAAVKAEVARILSRPGLLQVTPGDVAAECRAATGLDFSPTTIARYIQAHGWTRGEQPKGGVIYSAPSGDRR